MKDEEMITTVPKFKMIAFGEEFEAWPDSRKMSYLKKLASSMNHAADLMQQERNAIAEDMKVVKLQLEYAERNLGIQKNIVLTTITQNNLDKQNFIADIQALKAKVVDQENMIAVLNTRLESKS